MRLAPSGYVIVTEGPCGRNGSKADIRALHKVLSYSRAFVIYTADGFADRFRMSAVAARRRIPTLPTTPRFDANLPARCRIPTARLCEQHSRRRSRARTRRLAPFSAFRAGPRERRGIYRPRHAGLDPASAFSSTDRKDRRVPAQGRGDGGGGRMKKWNVRKTGVAREDMPEEQRPKPSPSWPHPAALGVRAVARAGTPRLIG